ncbi:shikimate dehydrogenase [Tatumella morbirosei]|uniref:Shikimate dehydrogenase (NADP(+)) n=1 Tax=Tatumella morbirosei TaxID=642227 RepID=A0A095ULP3_9GAMM|nr:shikimate dehydrogenase [Tatumella morbirosei]KGD75378.1 shikimate dehydrogenase [Tatumella morbirosei]
MAEQQNFLSELTGSFSSPCNENPTVAMMEEAYRHQGINARYINCDVGKQQLEMAVAGAKAMGWRGFNCSIPNKQAILSYIDEVGTSAKVIGAVNCVIIREGKLTGENTDGKGFVEALKQQIDPEGKKLALLGAGGAARAIAVESALAGVSEITIINRDKAKGEALAELINANTDATATYVEWSSGLKVDKNFDILVNATSVGLDDAEAMPDIDTDSLSEELFVADVIPNPPQTALLRAASDKGCRTLNGLNMLVNQGALNLAYWFDTTADKAPMRKVLQTLFTG